MNENIWHRMTTPPPKATNLLFGITTFGWVSAGWINSENGQPVLIGANFIPDCWRLLPAIELPA